MYIVFSFVPVIEQFCDIILFPIYIKRIRHNIGTLPLHVADLIKIAKSLLLKNMYTISGAYIQSGTNIYRVENTIEHSTAFDEIFFECIHT